MGRNWSLVIKIFGLLLGTVLLAACGNTSFSPHDPITVQFSWFHNVEFVGFYVAQEKGFYADENLDVTLLPGGPTVNPVVEVEEGRAFFGLTTGDALIRNRAVGGNLTAVASIFRHNPLVVMAMAGEGIRRPIDLVGKTVGVLSPDLSTPWDLQFLAVLNAAQVDPDQLKLVTVQDFTGANELTSGRADAASSFFVTNEPVRAELDGYQTENIFYSDYGVAIYPNPIFTTGQLIKDQPDVVERFVRATLKGYQYAIEHPDEAGQIAMKYDESQDLAFEVKGMQAQIPFIDTGDAPIGWMDEIVWQDTQEILLEQGIIAAPVDVNAVYTNGFVERAR